MICSSDRRFDFAIFEPPYSWVSLSHEAQSAKCPVFGGKVKTFQTNVDRKRVVIKMLQEIDLDNSNRLKPFIGTKEDGIYKIIKKSQVGGRGLHVYTWIRIQNGFVEFENAFERTELFLTLIMVTGVLTFLFVKDYSSGNTMGFAFSAIFFIFFFGFNFFYLRSERNSYVV